MMNRVLEGRGSWWERVFWGIFVLVRGVLETSAISILAGLLFENRYHFLGWLWPQ
jgi:hypothetical protein